MRSPFDFAPATSGLGWVLLAFLAFGGTSFAQVAPTITTQPPAVVAVDAGGTATFTVVANGTPPLSYQWLRNGGLLAGETGATLTIPNVQAGPLVGEYSVVVTNSAGSVTSQISRLRVNSAPYLAIPPDPVTAVAGSSVQFSCLVLGWPIPSYQWTKNGVAIPGATDLTLALTNIGATDAGDYVLVATNVYGSFSSPPATLTLSSGLIITSHPANQTVLAGQSAIFSVGVSPDPATSYQWQVRSASGAPWQNLADQGMYSGVTTGSLQVAGVTLALSQNRYRCVVTNSTGTEPSNGARLDVQLLAYSGGYFGDFDSGGGHWALYLNGNSATFLAFLPDRHSVIVLPLTVSDAGAFSASGVETVGTGGTAAAFTLTGQIAGTLADPAHRDLTAQLSGLGKTLAGSFKAGGAFDPATGTFYTALATKADQGKVYTIISYGGDLLSVVVMPGTVDGILGNISTRGTDTASLSGTTVNGATFGLTVTVSTHAVQVNYTISGSRSVSFLGLANSTVSTSRLVNLSVRSRAGVGDQTLIVGFVVSGSGTKTLLVRGIGPALGSYGVVGSMPNPRLRLFNSSGGLIGGNDDWDGGASLRTAFQSVGAFALDPTSRDSALLSVLSSGIYSAQVTSADGQDGVALLEAYDADASRATRMVNVSARTLAGAGADALIAGFVITGNAPMQLLIRGVGPTLAGYGVAGALANPKLQLFDSAGASILENDDWGGSGELTDTFAKVGAFTLASASSQDAALLVTLPPGVYSAQVSGVGGATGVALVEVYEVP